MRRIEEANKFELASSIKALVARALADEMIEGGMSAYGALIPGMVAIGGIADIVQHWNEMARSRMTQSGHCRSST